MIYDYKIHVTPGNVKQYFTLYRDLLRYDLLIPFYIFLLQRNFFLDTEFYLLYNVTMEGGVYNLTFLEKLDFLMKKNSLNKKRLSDQSGIPYSTIDGFYKQSYNNIKLSTFKKLCDFFGVTMDSMARDEVTEIEYYNPKKKDLHITPEEEILVKCYRSADDLDKTLALRAVNADQGMETKKENKNVG